MSGPNPDQDLGRRLRALVDHHVPEPIRQQHLTAIDAELARHHADAPVPASTLRGNAGRRSWTRRWAAGVATATALFVPAGAAVAASQSALPGDMLYPVKQLSEPVRGVFDPDVSARHRLDELESLLTHGSSPETLRSAADAAQLAVAGLPEHHRLHERLAALLALLAPPRTPSNDQAPVPAPNHPTQPADALDPVDNDADDDTDRAEPHDEYEPREVDDDVDTEHSDDTDGEEAEDEPERTHDLEDSEPIDDRQQDDDIVEDSDDIDEPDSDEVEDHHAVEPTDPDDEETEEEDADDDS